MYYFVEFLRAKLAMRIALIILGLFFLAAVVARLALHGGTPEDWASRIEHSPTAHVTSSKLPDGSLRVLVDDPQKKTHATILQSADGNSVHMVIIEPAAAARSSRHDAFSMGNLNMNEDVVGGESRVRMDYTKKMPVFDIGIVFFASLPMGFIVATLLGGVLAKENDGHLELAWTKPISRVQYAFGAVLVDAAAIILAQFAAIAVGLLATLLFFVPRFSFEPMWGTLVLLALLGALCWYALLTGISASIRRGPGLAIGLAWMVALFVPSIAAATQGAAQVNSIAAAVHAVFMGLSYLDPITYLSLHSSDASGTRVKLVSGTSVAALAALIVGYITLAVLQWRRVEA